MARRVDKAELLKDQIAGLEAAVDFYSQKRKSEREIWVVNEFLKNLHLRFKPSDLKPVAAGADPPDVLFRTARFEVVDMLDPDRKVHAEYKARLKEARLATDPEQLLKMLTPVDLAIDDLFARSVALAQKKASKYGASTCADLDLLIYANLLNIWEITGDKFPDPEPLMVQGWRSVSFLKGNRSGCWYAREDAPTFIHKTAGRITHRWR